MKKRLQVVLSDEAWAAVEAVSKEANESFDVGTISYSDAINEMVLSSRVDIDSVIKSLMELKSKSGKKKLAAANEELP